MVGNAIEPLLGWVQQNTSVPPEDSCIPVKNIVLADLMKKLWRHVLGFDTTAHLTQDDLDCVFGKLDVNGDGCLDVDELMRAFGETLMRESRGGQVAASGMLEQMVKSLE